MTNNKRIFDATPADRILDAQIDRIDAEMFAEAADDERRGMAFVTINFLLCAATFTAIGLILSVLVIFDERTILNNFYAFWRAII